MQIVTISDAAIIWSSPLWDPDCRWCGWNAPAYIARREHLAIVPDPAGSGANVLRVGMNYLKKKENIYKACRNFKWEF